MDNLMARVFGFVFPRMVKMWIRQGLTRIDIMEYLQSEVEEME